MRMNLSRDKLIAAVLDSLDSQIAVIDRGGVIVYVNQAWIDFGQANGQPRDQLWLGVSYLDPCKLAAAYGDEDAAQVLAGIRRVLDAGALAFEYEYPCHSPDAQRWFMMHVAPLRGLAGYFVVSHHVITARRLAEDRVRVQNAQLAALAATDNLTQLPNRRKLDETLGSEIARASRYESPLAVVIVDVDHFKQVNDTLGHDGGDAVLAEIARLLRTRVRSSDMAGRWGGEEFLILMPGSDAQAASGLAEELRAIIADHDFPGIGRVTCSFGAAEYRAGQSLTELFKHADVALYRAKRAGRNRVEVASGDTGAPRRRLGE